MTAWPWWLANCDLNELADLASYWGHIVGAAGLVLLLTLRILRTRGLDRRVYVPVHIASIVGMVVGMGWVVFLLVETVWGLVGSDWIRILHSLLVARAVIPVMFFLSNVGRRLLQLRIAGMVAEINVARTLEAIQAALRRALDDTSLMIYVWSPEHKQYVDAEGRPVSGDNRPHRVTLDLTVSDGTPSARIDADESVAHHPELLRAVCDAGGLALQNSALQSSLLATIELERSSRALSETLSHLLPTGLADRLRRDGLRIGQPELVEITVLMSDIRGYSGIAEVIDPAPVGSPAQRASWRHERCDHEACWHRHAIHGRCRIRSVWSDHFARQTR